MAKSNVAAAATINVERGTAYAGVATEKYAIYSAPPTAAGGGTECADLNYAKQAVTFGAPAVISGGEAATNTNLLDFPNGGTNGFASAFTVVALGRFDGSTFLGWEWNGSRTRGAALLPNGNIYTQAAASVANGGDGLAVGDYIAFYKTTWGTYPAELDESTYYRVKTLDATNRIITIEPAAGGSTITFAAFGECTMTKVRVVALSAGDHFQIPIGAITRKEG